METKKSENDCPVCNKQMHENDIMYFCPDEKDKKGCGASIYKDDNRSNNNPESR